MNLSVVLNLTHPMNHSIDSVDLFFFFPINFCTLASPLSASCSATLLSLSLLSLVLSLSLSTALWQLPLWQEKRHEMFSRHAEAHQALLGEDDGAETASAALNWEQHTLPLCINLYISLSTAYSLSPLVEHRSNISAQCQACSFFHIHRCSLLNFYGPKDSDSFKIFSHLYVVTPCPHSMSLHWLIDQVCPSTVYCHSWVTHFRGCQSVFHICTNKESSGM